MTFRLLTYNIWLGGQGRVDELARVIASCEPDLVLLQEATRADVVARLCAASGMTEWRTFEKQSLGYLSRRPVAHASWHKPRFSQHAFLEVVPSGQTVRLFGVHLSAVHSAWTEHRRVLELRSLLATVQRREPGFHVLAGDFNTLAPGATLNVRQLPLRLRPALWATGGRVRWRTVHTVLAAGYVDAYRDRHPDAPGFTMPAVDPHVRLDYAFLPAPHAGRLVGCDIVSHPATIDASDHLPLYVDFHVD